MQVRAPGTYIGKYRIVRSLGVGGMGVVYEASHPLLHNRLAIKTIRAELSGREGLAERFRTEAVTASRLRDDRLPQIYDIDELPDRTQYIVMEYLEGEDLEARLRGGAMGLGYATRVIFEVLEVLGRVHRLGIVHRDIKPSNIFLAQSTMLGEVPKLLDFGVAHLPHEHQREGRLVGTPMYMAPEQALGRGALGAGTDLFAAGLVLFEMITGQRPWPGEAASAYHQALAAGTPARSLSRVLPSAPLGLSEAIARALSLDPDRRFPNAEAFAAAIEPYAMDRAAFHELRRSSSADQERVSVVAETLDGSSGVMALSPTTDGSSAPLAEPTPSSGGSLSGVRRSRAGVRKLDSIRARLSRGGRNAVAAASPRGEARLRPGERRHVTVVYLGLRLHEGPSELASDELDQLAEQILDVFVSEFEERGAFVAQEAEDAFVAVFGYEQVLETDPEQALSAALAAGVQRNETNLVLSDVGCSITVNMGIHSGFVTRAEGRRGAEAIQIGGETVSVAHRLARNAPVNGVLVSRETRALLDGRFVLREAGRMKARGRAEAVDAYEVLGAAAASWERGAQRALPFFGRAAELARLEASWSEACEGGGPSMLLLTGAAGLGKTRLLSELLERIARDAERRTRILRSQASAAAPYALWGALLRSLLGTPTNPGGLAPQLDAALLGLGAALPPAAEAQLARQREVVDLLLDRGGEALLEAHSPSALDERIQLTLSLCVEAASRQSEAQHGRPLLIVIENAHRADSASLAILPRVLGAIREVRAPFVLLSARDAALFLDDGLELESVALPPLGPAALRCLAAALAGESVPSAAALDFIVRGAGGNPLFAEELVGALRDQSLLQATPQALRSARPPRSLYGLILARVDRLEPGLRRSLHVASVLGDHETGRFEARAFEAVHAALAGSPTSAPEAEDLQALVRAGLLLCEGSGYTFRNAPVQAAVYGTVLTENRRTLHRLSAQAIERSAEGGQRMDARLLHHYSRSDEVERTVHYARRVGRQALGVAAYEEAIDALRVAATQQERLGTGSGAALEVPAARTLLSLATAYLWRGRLGEAATRVTEGLQRLAMARPLAAKGLALRGELHMVQVEICKLRTQPEQAVTHLEVAERAFASAGQPMEAAKARSWRGYLLRRVGRPDEGLTLASEGWAQLKDAEDLGAVCRAGHDLGNVLREMGRAEDSLPVFARAVEAGDALRARGNTTESIWGSVASRSGRAMSYALLGRLDEAVGDQRQAVALAVGDGNRVAEAVVRAHLTSHLLEQGELEEAGEMAARALAVAEAAGMSARAVKVRCVQARIHLAAGHREAAVLALEEAEALVRRVLLPVATWFEVTERLLPLSDGPRRAELLALARAHASEDPSLEPRVEALVSGAVDVL